MIKIYFHIATIGRWEEIVKELWKDLEDYGLLNECESVNVVVLGDPETLEAIKKMLSHPKTIIRHHSTDLSLYERPTLSLLHQDAVNSKEPFKAVYFHSKGVKHNNSTPIYDWVRYLAYFNIHKWKECVDSLEEFDTCGVNLQPLPKLHYSGNFWWANSDYIAKLDPIIGPEYLDPEMWVCGGTPKARCMFSSHVNHYLTEFPRHKYVPYDNYIDTTDAKDNGIDFNLSATYGTDKIFVDVSKKVISNFLNNRTISIMAGTKFNDCFGDPVPSMVKQLTIQLDKIYVIPEHRNTDTIIEIP